MDTNKVKRHADFQDAYRRSSNFRSFVKNEKFELTEKGKVKYKISEGR